MALLTIAEVRDLITTDLSDADLVAILDREEAQLVAKLGAHGDGAASVTEVLSATDGWIFLPRPAASVTSVDGVTTGLTVYGKQGRVYRAGAAGDVTVIYVPTDDRAARREALIDLLRLTLQRTALRAESVAGEYSYQAPDWQAERAAIYRRLMFTSV